MAFEYLAQYTTFNSIADMDKSVEEHIQQHFYELTESERAIVYKLASHSLNYPGVCHLKASTIADSLEISTKTVYRAIKNLESLGIIKKQSTTKEKGGRGANIYIILPVQSETCESHYEPLEVVPLQEVYIQVHAEKETHKEYMNEYQVMLYDFMHSMPLADHLKDELYKCVLASQVETVDEFIKAKNVLFKIAMDIKDGVLTITSTLRAVFVGAYSKAVERSNMKSNKIILYRRNS